MLSLPCPQGVSLSTTASARGADSSTTPQKGWPRGSLLLKTEVCLQDNLVDYKMWRCAPHEPLKPLNLFVRFCTNPAYRSSQDQLVKRYLLILSKYEVFPGSADTLENFGLIFKQIFQTFSINIRDKLGQNIAKLVAN